VADAKTELARGALASACGGMILDFDRGTITIYIPPLSKRQIEAVLKDRPNGRG